MPAVNGQYSASLVLVSIVQAGSIDRLLKPMLTSSFEQLSVWFVEDTAETGTAAGRSEKAAAAARSLYSPPRKAEVGSKGYPNMFEPWCSGLDSRTHTVSSMSCENEKNQLPVAVDGCGNGESSCGSLWNPGGYLPIDVGVVGLRVHA